jgi:hypothetical protein
MVDTFGDSWNGNIMTISDCNHTVLATNLTLNSGRNIQGVNLCLDESVGHHVQVGGGNYQNEIRWELLNSAGKLQFRGGAPFVGSVNCPRGWFPLSKKKRESTREKIHIRISTIPLK